MTTSSHSPSAAVASKPTITIIGLGRVGRVLGRALHRAGYPIHAVASRDADKAAAVAASLHARALSMIDAARAADLTLLTISDDAIPDVVAELARSNAWHAGQYVVHASGVSPASVLQPATVNGAIIGAFHPLAAIAHPDLILPSGLTFAIEAPQPLHDLLDQMARDLGGSSLDLLPEHKTLYHAAAVIASNYTVTLAALATQIFEQLGTTPDQGLHALLPLMRTTIDNLDRQGLPHALTGPLVRGDVGTVLRHLQELDRSVPHVGELYRCLAQGTLPLAQQRGLDPTAAGALQDAISLPSDLILDRDQSLT